MKVLLLALKSVGDSCTRFSYLIKSASFSYHFGEDGFSNGGSADVPCSKPQNSSKGEQISLFLFFMTRVFFSWSQDGKMLSCEAEAPPKHVKKVRPMEKKKTLS